MFEETINSLRHSRSLLKIKYRIHLADLLMIRCLILRIMNLND